MKKALLCLSIIALILSGCKSKEEKATELIKQEMFKTLYDFESYQPIETKVDSAFTSIYTDSTILSHAYIVKQLLIDVDKCLNEIREAKSTMDIWGDSYSSLSKTKYNDAYEKYKENLEKAQSYIKVVNSSIDSIKILASDFRVGFCGWKVTHKFRCKTKGGNPDIGNYIYIFDKDMKNIIHKEDQDDEALLELKKTIKEAISENTN